MIQYTPEDENAFSHKEGLKIKKIKKNHKSRIDKTVCGVLLHFSPHMEK